jgi:hypothetical protein
VAEKQVTVIEDPENPVPVEIMAQAIVDVAEAAKKLLAGPLTRRAVVLLIYDNLRGRVTKSDIEDVLDGAKSLDRYVIAGMVPRT